MKEIAILGGGFTGLSAAYKLAQEGYSVTLYEKSKSLGGLAGGFKIENNNLEKAYHHIFRTDTDIINFATELGLSESLKWHESSVAIYYNQKIYPFMTPLDLLRFSPLKIFNRVRAGVVVLFLQKTSNFRQFIKVSAYNWMKKFAGNEVTKVIWEPLLKGKFDKFYNTVSMAWLWARIHIRANSRAKGDSKEMLGYFDGGFQILIDKIAEKLREKGVEIILEANVEKIEVDKNVTITVNESERTFPYLIVTLPNHVFAKLISTSSNVTIEYLKQLNSINYLGAVLYVFTSSQEISKYYWHNINDLNAPFLVFINHTRLIDKSQYNNQYVYYIGAYLPHDHRYFTETDLTVQSEWENYLLKIFPDFDKNQIREKNLFRFKYAQHIVDANYQERIPAYKTPLRNVYLSNFSQIFPEDRGTNYAVKEGFKIADLVLKEDK